MTAREALNADLPPLVTKVKNARSHVASWVEMRALEPSLTQEEAARRLGIAPSYLKSIIQKAVKEGWLVFEDPMSRLEHEIIPKTVDNINSFLDVKDKQVTIEVAKGVLFKQFLESKGISEAPKTILAIKLEYPDAPAQPIQIVSSKVVGKPKQFEDTFDIDPEA